MLLSKAALGHEGRPPWNALAGAHRRAVAGQNAALPVRARIPSLWHCAGRPHAGMHAQSLYNFASLYLQGRGFQRCSSPLTVELTYHLCGIIGRCFAAKY